MPSRAGTLPAAAPMYPGKGSMAPPPTKTARHHPRSDGSPLLWTSAFFLFILACNTQLFTQPLTEFSDFAANSLLVQQAKHFTLLTGHYSRWHFQHPGPAFLYLFALGEFIFHDVLHLVPSPYNGQLLIAILFNGTLLYAALYIFRRHAKLPVPLALLVVLVLVILSGNPSLVASNWMPDVMLFPFLLFAVSAASVLAGETRDLPFLAFSGMLLIHAHFAQFLFVGAIGGGAVAYILARAQRQDRLRALLSERRRDFLWASAIVFVFIIPPLLEIVLDKPNNLDALLAYQRQYGHLRNTLGMSIGYLACFLLLLTEQPILALTRGPAGILALAFSRPSVIAYWAALVLLGAVAIMAWRRAKRPSPFLGYLMLVGAASLVLFVFWATRIVGGFFAFNGNFIYFIHLLAWFFGLGAVGPLLNWRVLRTLNVLALVLLLALGVAGRKALRSVIVSRPEALEAAKLAPVSQLGRLAIEFDVNNWPFAVAVANSMERLGKPVCVGRDWGFMFSSKNVCADLLMADELWLRTDATACLPPCRYLYRGVVFSLTEYPAQPLALTVEAGLRESPGLDMTGFNDDEGDHRWLQKHAAIRFRLSPELPPGPCFRLALTGYAFPGRPTQIAINGRFLSTLVNTELGTALFVVPRGVLRPGGVNRITMDTERAAPVGEDRREIGFGFVRLILRAATSDESCPAF
jgi:hypothetical protein